MNPAQGGFEVSREDKFKAELFSLLISRR